MTITQHYIINCDSEYEYAETLKKLLTLSALKNFEINTYMVSLKIEVIGDLASDDIGKQLKYWLLA